MISTPAAMTIGFGVAAIGTFWMWHFGTEVHPNPTDVTTSTDAEDMNRWKGLSFMHGTSLGYHPADVQSAIRNYSDGQPMTGQDTAIMASMQNSGLPDIPYVPGQATPIPFNGVQSASTEQPVNSPYMIQGYGK